MKKRLLIFLTMISVLLCACGNQNVATDDTKATQEAITEKETANNKEQTSTKTQEPTPADTQESTPANTQEPTPADTQKPTSEKTDKKAENSALEIHYIDVGQGDSIFLRCGDETMLIDAGDNEHGAAVVKYLSKLNVTKIDYAVGTHPDADHIGGMDNVISSFDIGKILMPKRQSNTKTFEDVLTAISNKGLKIKAPAPGDEFSLGSATVRVLGPISEGESNNDNSIVLRISHGKNAFLMMGDAELQEEYEILETDEDLSATILKVGHHGSHSSTTEEFLDRVDPEYAVISCGKDNKYGHPHTETVQALKKKDVKILRTDTQGNIVVTSDGNKIKTKTSKSEKADAEDTDKKESNVSKGQEQTVGSYIGNKSTKKFHRDTCSTLPHEENRVYFDSREEAVADGYVPCRRCNP